MRDRLVSSRFGNPGLLTTFGSGSVLAQFWMFSWPTKRWLRGFWLFIFARHNCDLNIKAFKQLQDTAEVRVDIPSKRLVQSIPTQTCHARKRRDILSSHHLVQGLENQSEIVCCERLVQVFGNVQGIIPQVARSKFRHCPVRHLSLALSFVFYCVFQVTAIYENPVTVEPNILDPRCPGVQ